MLIVELNNILLKEQNSLPDAFLIGIEGFSSEAYKHFKKSHVIEIIKDLKTKKVLSFIDLTNIYHDEDLLKVKDLIEELDADGYFYSDLGIMEYLPFEKRFFFSQTYITNKYDLNIALKENKYVLISPNLSLLELKDFEYNENIYLIGFGTWEIFHSRRPLLTNYFKYREIESALNGYHIMEEFRNDTYPIIEENGFKVYLNDYFCLDELLTNNLIIKTFDLEPTIALKVIECFKNQDLTLIKELPIKTHPALLHQESILTKGDKNA